MPWPHGAFGGKNGIKEGDGEQGCAPPPPPHRRGTRSCREPEQMGTPSVSNPKIFLCSPEDQKISYEIAIRTEAKTQAPGEGGARQSPARPPCRSPSACWDPLLTPATPRLKHA